MKTEVTKIINDKVCIDCPNCDMWEEISIDESRYNLQSMPIIEWLSYPKEYDISVNKCNECNEFFRLEWNYENIRN